MAIGHPETGAKISRISALNIRQPYLSLSLIPGRGTSHRPNRLQEVHHVSWVGVVSGGACLHVGRTAQEQMLCCLIVASAVWTQWRLLSSDSMKAAGQKWRVARSQLSDSDTLTSGPAKSPVELRTDLSGKENCNLARLATQAHLH